MNTSTIDVISSTATPTTPQTTTVARRRRRWGWERPAFFGLLGVTGLLYVWNLAASGWANSFYSAAVQAGSKDWVAFFYGSSDAGNSITVDKPPASLWIMELSARIFGLSSWSILIPEALMGVATVAALYASVRRRYSAGTALFAGGALAVTPVAALMFRFNNPDALLVLLMTLAVYFTIRATEHARLRWLLLAGAMVGFGFLTKQLQVLLIVPPLALVYLWAAPVRFRTRLWHSIAALGAIIVSAGWWVAIVELVPASMRPYIGGSQSNDFLQLTLGYNGFGRLTGNEVGSVTGGGGNTTGAGMWGATGITRLFSAELGGQISWLLPAALVLMVIGFVLTWRLPRVSLRRAILVVFASWMLLTGLFFSFMAGIFHPYYTIALAPAVAAVAAIGAQLLWDRRARIWARILLAVALGGTAVWAWVLLDRSTDWLPWLKYVVAILAVIGAALLLLPPAGRMLARATIATSVLAALLAPTAYTIQTVTTAHTGSIPSAGPAVAGGMGFGGGRGFGGARPGGFGGGQRTFGGPTAGGTTGAPTGGFGGRGGGVGFGGLLGSSTVSSTVAKTLEANATSYTWVAAAIGSNSAAGYQLATGDAVMPIGGFNGSDPSPTLAQFKALVKADKIHYFIGGRIGASNGGSSDSSKIAAWVEAHYTAKTVDGVTLYDLSS